MAGWLVGVLLLYGWMAGLLVDDADMMIRRRLCGYGGSSSEREMNGRCTGDLLTATGFDC